jgi:undecaprenyl-diphosphatase
MTLKEAVILGAVEGITEFLPVSSTGHLILTAHLLGLEHDDFTKSFEIAIQLGAILAVLSLYFRRMSTDRELWKRILVAFIPTGVVGFLMYRLIKDHLLGNDTLVVFTLLVGGAVLLVADRLERRDPLEDARYLSLKGAFLVGLFQSLAVVPGVSRSGSTIVGGLVAGLSRRASAEFSFLLAVPTIGAATVYDLIKTGGGFSGEQWGVLGVGFLTAFLTAAVTVRAFLGFLSRHGFKVFGLYRIGVALLYGLLFL